MLKLLLSQTIPPHTLLLLLLLLVVTLLTHLPPSR
jgi:hypothetical protein